ncbi:hypothetical protein AB0269_03335 [Microbacterium sp. NPDC077644]|uniref:hypothetical protein n=1 Tax=Microbacterium sp. NPDC077644 TaxID=3155055 RepID=UPI00344C89B0
MEDRTDQTLAASQPCHGEDGGDQVRREHPRIRGDVGRGGGDRREHERVVMSRAEVRRRGGRVQDDEEDVEDALRDEHRTAQPAKARARADQQRRERGQEDEEREHQQRMGRRAAAERVRDGRDDRRGGGCSGTAHESQLPGGHASSICGGFLSLGQ